MQTIVVNGDEVRITPAMTVWQYLESLDLDPKKVAVERNLEIVPKSTFQNVQLNAGDVLEIVHFIGGG